MYLYCVICFWDSICLSQSTAFLQPPALSQSEHDEVIQGYMYFFNTKEKRILIFCIQSNSVKNSTVSQCKPNQMVVLNSVMAKMKKELGCTAMCTSQNLKNSSDPLSVFFYTKGTTMCNNLMQAHFRSEESLTHFQTVSKM